jgi:uncharacterized protein (DUF2267 family)
MRYDEFLKHLEQHAGMEDRTEAARTAAVVLQALSDRLAGGEADDLLAQLPAELKRQVTPVATSVPMDPDEFVERVAADLGLPEDAARERVRAVFATLREAVTPGEWDDVMSQLDRKYAELVG